MKSLNHISNMQIFFKMIYMWSHFIDYDKLHIYCSNRNGKWEYTIKIILASLIEKITLLNNLGREKPNIDTIKVQIYIHVYFWLHHEAFTILVSQQRIETEPLAVEVQRPNHWTDKEFLKYMYVLMFALCPCST